jgi:hypothetical protein
MYRYKRSHDWEIKGTFATFEEALVRAKEVREVYYDEYSKSYFGEVDVYDDGSSYGWKHITSYSL